MNSTNHRLAAALAAATLLIGPRALAAQATHDHGAAASSTYVDIADRDIKALGDDEVRALLEGDGMGYALPAELNGYPGPKHVLELADSLELTPEQRARTQEIRDAMLTDARRLGAAIVDAERALDRAFAGSAVTQEALRGATAEIARLEGELRAAHLAAHIEMKALLSEHQAHRYDALRGYGDAHGAHGGVDGSGGGSGAP